MKKTKLLTSVAALALVLSLGACDQPEEDTSEDEETSQTTETDTGSSQEPVTLKNYTISITLKDAATEESVAIPFYDTVYICGSWDNWANWIALTNVGTDDAPILTTTFASIDEGTYEFKGVIGGQEDEPSWNLTEFIVNEEGKNVSFTVSATEGDNYTNNLEYTVDASKVPVLEETPMTEEEIAGLIIEAAGDVYDNLGWDAFHGKEVEDEELSMEVWLTTDEDGEVYGKVVSYDDEDVETRFIVSGTQYTIEADGEYTTYYYNQDYEDEFSNYADGLDTVSSAEASSCEITHVEGSTTYTLTLADDEDEIVVVVAQRAGDTFTVISVSSSDDGDVYSAEKITAREVEAQMSGFNADFWNPLYFGEASSPAELVEKAALRKNYSVQIEYDVFTSNGTITESEYYELYDLLHSDEELTDEQTARLEELYAKYESLFEDYSVVSYIADIYYTEDSVHYIEYLYDEGTENYVRDGYEVIFVNDPSVGMWEYVTYDGFETASIYYGAAGYSWWNYTYSLIMADAYGALDDLEYSTTTDEGYDVYYFNWLMDYIYGDAAYWFVYLGGDLFFGDASYAFSYLSYYFYDEGTYFSENDQTMTTIWSDEGGLWYTDDKTEIYFSETDIYTTVYDVGETVEDDEVSYWHNYWQTYIGN